MLFTAVAKKSSKLLGFYLILITLALMSTTVGIVMVLIEHFAMGFTIIGVSLVVLAVVSKILRTMDSEWNHINV